MRWSLLAAVTGTLLLSSACLDWSSFGAKGFRCSSDAECDEATFCFEDACHERIDAGPKPTRFNTGVPQLPAGVTLERMGGITLDQDGGVLDLKEIEGCVTIAASGVTLRRSKIRCSTYWMIKVEDGARDVLLEDVEIDGLGFVDGVAISGSNYTVRRANVHGVKTAVLFGDNVLVEGSYVHDLAGPGSGISSGGASNVEVRGNNIEAPLGMGNAMVLDTTDSALKDVRITRNWFSGGKITVYVGGPGTVRTEVNENRFGRNASQTPLYLREGALATGNVYDDDGTPLNP